MNQSNSTEVINGTDYSTYNYNYNYYDNGDNDNY